MQPAEIVITGLGVVTPIGIDREAFWESLCGQRSGVRRISLFDPSALPSPIAGEVPDFDPKAFIPRKQMKLMCRDARLGVAAAALACRDARIAPGAVDPDRLGVVLGADRIGTQMDDCESTYRACMADGRFDFRRWGNEGMAATFPLSFLKVLPNMVASHVSILQDARGPNNTIHHADLSGLLAVAEAAEVIRRGAADVMLAGGASSQMNPYDCVRRCVMGILSRRQDDPAAALRPFDARRDGQVWGEGAAVLILESRRHAEARGATILARLLGAASAGQPRSDNCHAGAALAQAARLALARAEVQPRQLGHVNAHGNGGLEDDRAEAAALRAVVPETPVTAPKSYFGNLSAAAGAVELAVSVLAMKMGAVPPTLNHDEPDPDCPVPVISQRPLRGAAPLALAVNTTPAGQATAVVLAGAE